MYMYILATNSTDILIQREPNKVTSPYFDHKCIITPYSLLPPPPPPPSLSLSLSLSPEVARKVKSCVLIHCMAGISRSVTLTIAYLMSHFGLPMTSAYQYVKERRPAISPNLNFMGQLVEFENCATTSSSSSSSAGSETGGEGKEGGSGCLPLKLEDFAPSQEQDEMSEMMKVSSSLVSPLTPG